LDLVLGDDGPVRDVSRTPLRRRPVPGRLEDVQLAKRSSDLDSLDFLRPLRAEVRAAELQVFLADLELDAGEIALAGREGGQVVATQSARGIVGEFVCPVRLQVEVSSARFLRCRSAECQTRDQRDQYE